ncbi:MAG: hypothetical protein JSR72_07395 [Proteobacteria bacterium]|nr:hypothetical protein [Pseudomonadota bacterium]
MKQAKRKALPVIALLLLAAPAVQQSAPSNVMRVEDPEPLPDRPAAPVAPGTLPDPARPAGTRPPIAPDRRPAQPPSLVVQPEQPAPPVKGPADAPK